jgi:tetratricopeptide (TPR) repeat protein
VTAEDPVGRRRLEAAVREHREGRLSNAVAAYEDMLRRDPGDADVMQRLGVALLQMGRSEEGVLLLAGSLEVEPDRPAVLLNLARALHSLGRNPEALTCCDRAVALDAGLADGYRVRSAVLAAMGRHEDALANSGQAVRLAPRDAASNADFGTALAAVGRTADAMQCFERAVELDPAFFAAHCNLAFLEAQQGRHERALQSLDRALALQPQHAALHSNRGNSLKSLGRFSEALASYATAFALEPGNLETLHNRAVVHMLAGQHAEALRDYDELIARHDEPAAADLVGRGAALVALARHNEAIEPLDRAIALLPRDPEAHVQRGVAMLRLNRFREALESFDRALAIRANLPEVLNNRAVALAALDRPKEALDSLTRSLLLDGAAADTHTNSGVLLKALGRHVDAAWSFNRALSLRPDDPAASLELGFLHLSLGEFRQGWPLYEARFRVPALGVPRRNFNAPRWDGTTPIAGKALLVHSEQGLGDTIQFCRYVRMLAAAGASVVLEVAPNLRALLQSLPGPVRIVARGEPLPAVDYHCPLLSLPLAFDTQLQSIPNEVPYLAAEPQRVVQWGRRLQDVKGLRVGIAWQGNPDVEQLIWARGRSIPLTAFAPLAEIEGVRLISLQKGAGMEQLDQASFRDRIEDLRTELDLGADAFVDAAAVMAGLDLVITSDTSIAHLAGALARPVWVALNAAPDWRWLLKRSDTPWYPSMRLFRQPRAGAWGAVIGDMLNALRPMAARSTPRV